MKSEIKAIWLSALRDGKYTQAMRRLRVASGGFCCLGVLCDLHARETGSEWLDGASGPGLYYGKDWSTLSLEVRDWAGLDEKNPQITTFLHEGDEILTLAEANDVGLDFDAIADIIERDL